MRKWIAGPAIAGLMLIGTASVVDAAPAQAETSDDDGGFDDWGLLGLLGLAGLAGLKRRDNNNHSYERNTASTRTP